MLRGDIGRLPGARERWAVTSMSQVPARRGAVEGMLGLMGIQGFYTMRYFVRWTVASDRSEASMLHAFPTITEALDQACDLIARHRPREIWVVDERGERTAADFQVRSYRQNRRHAPRPFAAP